MRWHWLLALLIVIGLAGTVDAGSTRVRGSTKRNGTYVQPHVRTSPDGRKSNNWSTQGNINPYTGKKGTKSPY